MRGEEVQEKEEIMIIVAIHVTETTREDITRIFREKFAEKSGGEAVPLTHTRDLSPII
jgi:hypothetical protein